MAFIDGFTLHETLEMGPLNVNDALDTVIQVAEGLQHAHEKGIIHRDIKLSNIMITGRGQAKITDFGLAKLLGHTSITETGTIMGTVDYMSPEQARGEPVDHRTDIWSLGVVLYMMLTAELPFRGDNAQAIIYSIMHEDPVQMAHWQPAVPASLEQAVRKMMQKDPLKRYEDMGAVIRDLQSIKKDPTAVPVSEELAGPFITRRTPFVGRQGEREELRGFLERAKNGNGTLVMLGGEPGVGKTRMTEELEAEARRYGFLTLTGHCYEMEGAPPYIPFIEILQSIMRTVEPDKLLETLGDAAPEVAKLVPELREQFPDISEPRKLPPEQERLYLFNKLSAFLGRLANNRPLLIMVEDLHWTDEPTLLLLQHMAQRLPEVATLIVGTYRDTELDVARSLAKALEELLRQRLAHDMLLKRLPQDGVTAMLRGRSGQEPPSRLANLIFDETEGNPFFVEEVFNHLAEEEKLFDSEGRWRSDVRVDEWEVPRGVLLVIGRRLERASEECRRTLARAAVIGRGVSFKLLKEVIELDEDTLLDALEEAERAQLISVVTTRGKDSITFVHELIRQTLLNDLSTPRRRRLHLRVAEVLEQLYAGTLEQHAADLAHHYYQAGGDADKIIDYCVMAAKRSTAQTAYEDAVEQCHRALQALEQREPVDELRRCDLLLGLGNAYGNAGDPVRAKQTFLKAAAIAKKVPAPEQLAKAAVGVCEFWFALVSVDYQLVDFLYEALEFMDDEDSALRASLLGRLSFVLQSAGDDRSITVSEQAIVMARRFGDPEALWYALFARVFVWDRPLEERIADAAELARLEEDSTCPVMGDQGLNHLSHVHLVSGDIAAFDRDLVIMQKRAGETQHPTTIWTLTFINGAHAQMLGRFKEAEELMLQAFALGDNFNEVIPTVGYKNFLFHLRYLQGRLHEIDDEIQDFFKQFADVQKFQTSNALLHLTLGRKDQAREEFERLAADNFAVIPRNWFRPTMLMHCSEMAVTLADMPRTELLYDMLGTCHDRLILCGINNACVGTRSHYFGLLAATLKRWDDAASHFEDALEFSARVGARPFLARSQHEYARMLIDRDESGDKEKAKEFLSDAIATYREIGMPTFLENAEELLEKV